MWLTRLALRDPVLILMMSLFPAIDIPVVRVATFP